MVEKRPKFTTFYCFTPEVSLATFFIEIALALYVIFRYKLTLLSKLAVIEITLLGMFQLSEYALCSSSNTVFWAKFGAASITLLPVLSLHMVTLVTRKSMWTWIGYVLGAGFIYIFLFSPYVVLNTVCTGKFVVYDPMNNLYKLIYTAYYMGFFAIAIKMLVESITLHKGDRKVLLWGLILYISILAPTAVVNLLVPYTRSGMPSIMCGFAVLVAIILVVKVLPRYYKVNKIK